MLIVNAKRFLVFCCWYELHLTYKFLTTLRVFHHIMQLSLVDCIPNCIDMSYYYSILIVFLCIWLLCLSYALDISQITNQICAGLQAEAASWLDVDLQYQLFRYPMMISRKLSILMMNGYLFVLGFEIEEYLLVCFSCIFKQTFVFLWDLWSKPNLVYVPEFGLWIWFLQSDNQPC